MNQSFPSHIVNAINKFEKNINFYYSYFADKALEPPDTIQITLTYKCNLKCKMCNIRNIEVDSDITSERVISLVDEAVEWKVPELLLLGGEPFLHKDIIKFIRYAGNKKMKTTIVTNGTLIDSEMAKMIVDSPLTQLVISLDGAREKTHDSLRKAKSAYRKVINAIKMVNKCKKRKLRKRFDFPLIIIPITLMNDNLHEMWEYVILGNKLPVSAVGFQPIAVNNADLKFNDTNSPMWIPESRLSLLDKMIDKVIEYKKRRSGKQPVIGNTFVHLEAIKKHFRGQLSQQYIKCYMGYTRVAISPDSNVSLCGKGIGNVNYQTMRDIWNSEIARQERSNIKKCQKPCLQFCSIRPESELEVAFDVLTKRIDLVNCGHETTMLVINRLLSQFSDIENTLKENMKNDDNLNMLENEINNIKNKLMAFKK